MAGDHFPASDHPNEPAAVIFSEHTWLQGAFLGAVAYGIEFVLYIMASYLLWMHRHTQGQTTERSVFLIFYISIIFILSTLFIAGLLQVTQEAFIDGRNIPGGPNVFEEVMFYLPINRLVNVIMVLNAWLCDITNVWRCFVIYTGCTVAPAWVVCMIPALLYFASVVFGIIFLRQVSTVNQSPWDTSGINFTVPYFSMSLSLNILVTILIVLRLLVYRHRITKAMGSSYGYEYTSLVAVVIESAAIYSAFALTFLIPFAVNSAVSQLFFQALSIVQVLSTFLIIFRIAQGKGWSRETYSKAVTLSTFQQAPVNTNGGATHTVDGTAREISIPQSRFTFGSSSELDATAATNIDTMAMRETPIMLRKFQTSNEIKSGADPEVIEISKAVNLEQSHV